MYLHAKPAGSPLGSPHPKGCYLQGIMSCCEVHLLFLWVEKVLPLPETDSDIAPENRWRPGSLEIPDLESIHFRGELLVSRRVTKIIIGRDEDDETCGGVYFLTDSYRVYQ